MSAEQPPSPPPARHVDPAALALVDRMIAACGEARESLDAFVKAHPYLMAPNMAKMMDEHLKENGVTMQRVRDQATGRDADR